MSAELNRPTATQSEPSEKDPVSQGEAEVVRRHEGRPACFNSTIQEISFVFSATMAIAMGSFTTGAIVVVSSFVGKDSHMSTAEVTWISSASTLAGGSFSSFFGRVADSFGRKSLFVGSLFFFAVFALAAGFAKTPISLDVLNGVMGLMTASAVPPAQGIMGVIYEKPSRRKNLAFACYSAGNPSGFVFGTIFSGIAANIFNWRASFWLSSIIYLVLSIVAIFTVPKDFTPKEPLNLETIKRFDIVGTILTVAGIGMFSAAISLADTAPQGWKTNYVLASLIVGIASMAAFIVWENYFPYPSVPLGIWKDRNFSLCIGILLSGFMAFPIAIFFISLFFQDVWLWSPLQVAVHSLPSAIMGISVNLFAGLVLHRISNKSLMYVGAAAYCVAFTSSALNRERDIYWAFCFPAFILAVVGADLEFNVANMYVMSSSPPEQQSIAGGIFQTVTKLCMTLGYGIATAVFNSVSKDPSMGGYYKDDRQTQPYSAVLWATVAASGLSSCMVPFLTIGTQGGHEEEKDDV